MTKSTNKPFEGVVCIMKLNAEDFFIKKTINFSERRREIVRKGIKHSTGADEVWFSDEEPPEAFVHAIQEQARADGYEIPEED
jgi:hypothetical protein